MFAIDAPRAIRAPAANDVAMAAGPAAPRAPRRRDGRVVIHLDYDAFYCAVVEAESPQLKRLPLAVQRKSAVRAASRPMLTAGEQRSRSSSRACLVRQRALVNLADGSRCNYEARRRGLHKLQLVTEARRLCPDLVIVLGEDLTRFRNASKLLYRFLRRFSWNGRVERLGFDEIWLDVTDQVDYNVNLLNPHDLHHAYFCLAKDDPTHGFAFDATAFAGNTFPASGLLSKDVAQDPLRLRLLVGSHLAHYLRAELEHHTNYTATVGISTNKLLSKLAGNVKKPNAQTTLLPPYDSTALDFIDAHDIGRIPGIGFKLAQKLREFILHRPAAFSDGLVYGGTEEAVAAGDVRKHVGVSAETLEKILAGPGSPHGIGAKVWGLLHGVDDSEVGQARDVPRQISIEDSYVRLDTHEEVAKELKMLALSLLKRMHLDLLEDEEGDDEAEHKGGLGTEICTSIDSLAERLVNEALLPLFRRLHPEKSGWNLSLVNVAVTNMADSAGDAKTSSGRDIGAMFKKQNEVLNQWRVTDENVLPDPGADPVTGVADGGGDGELSAAEVSHELATESPSRWPEPRDAERQHPAIDARRMGSEDLLVPGISSQDSRATLDDGEADSCWIDEAEGSVDEAEVHSICDICGALMPAFAIAAHARYHALEE
ncbi:DNA-repair protein [Neofusicoccum parvum]|nr:DNA-repair protein [Neofusicoccum parvum]